MIAMNFNNIYENFRDTNFLFIKILSWGCFYYSSNNQTTIKTMDMHNKNSLNLNLVKDLYI